MRISHEANLFILSRFRLPIGMLGEIDFNARCFGQQTIVRCVRLQPFGSGTLGGGLLRVRTHDIPNDGVRCVGFNRILPRMGRGHLVTRIEQSRSRSVQSREHRFQGTIEHT